MPRSIFGWDLPPGCRVSDIPGNRPEDERWESIYETFWEKDRLGSSIAEEHYKKMDELFNDPASADCVDAYISAAIEYGMEVADKEAVDSREENKYYDRLAVEKAFEDAKDKDEALKKVLYYLGLSKEEA